MLVFTPQFFNLTIEKKKGHLANPKKKKREKKEVDEERDKRKERE